MIMVMAVIISISTIMMMIMMHPLNSMVKRSSICPIQCPMLGKWINLIEIFCQWFLHLLSKFREPVGVGGQSRLFTEHIPHVGVVGPIRSNASFSEGMMFIVFW